MPQWHPSECKVCGARSTHVRISGTGLCPDHSRMRMLSNVEALRAKQGPEYERWLRGIARGVVSTARRTNALDALRDSA